MPQRIFTDEEEAEIAKLYTVGGFSARAIGRVYGKYHSVIVSSLKRQGVTQRPPAERNRLYKLNPHVFDVIDNEHAAYWLGFIYADGAVYKRSLVVYLSAKDEIVIKRLKEFMQSEAPVKYTTGTAGKTDKRYKQVGIEFTDEHLANRLISLGIVPRRAELNSCLSQIQPDMVRHWIRGIVDGDGSFHSYKPGFNIVGRQLMLEFIRNVFANEIGRNPKIKIHQHPTANIHNLVYMGRPQCLIIAEWLYKDATIWLPRKRDVVESYPDPQKRTRNHLGQFE